MTAELTMTDAVLPRRGAEKGLCYSRKVRARLPLIVAGVALSAASCGSAPAAVRPPTRTTVPLPAGRNPSYVSRQVCSSEAQHDIGEVLGIKAVVPTPTWLEHLYSCQYRYPDGTMTLSVKELSSWDQTKAYYAGLGREMGNVGALGNLGQGAFTTSDGSVVVRKDWKVLLVNIAGLPTQFGVPPTPKADVADTVSDVILGCWAGD
jgi:hypothetical protein